MLSVVATAVIDVAATTNAVVELLLLLLLCCRLELVFVRRMLPVASPLGLGGRHPAAARGPASRYLGGRCGRTRVGVAVLA